MTIQEIITKYSSQILPVYGDPVKDIEILLMKVTGYNQAKLLANLHTKLSRLKLLRFKNYFRKLKKGLPLAYVLGETYFHGYRFKVNKNTLIPRPETELLVDLAQEYIVNHPIRNVVDIGTGSGIIIIILAKLLEPLKRDYNFIATDISNKTLTTARINGLIHKQKINFRLRDLVKKPNTFLPLTSWVLISNPPYLKTIELNEPSIAFEPKLALEAGDEGLDIYSSLFEDVSKLQNKPKAIFLEIGHDQAKGVEVLAQKYINYKTLEVFKDFNGHSRVVKIVLAE